MTESRKSNRTHGASGISADDAKCFSTKPIAAINLDDLIAYDTVVDKFSSNCSMLARTLSHKRRLHLI